MVSTKGAKLNCTIIHDQISHKSHQLDGMSLDSWQEHFIPTVPISYSSNLQVMEEFLPSPSFDN